MPRMGVRWSAVAPTWRVPAETVMKGYLVALVMTWLRS
jgi:hypothetical protein